MTNIITSFNDFKDSMPFQISEYFSNKSYSDLSIQELAYIYLNVNWNHTTLKDKRISTSLYDLVENTRASYNNNRTRVYTPLLGSFILLDQLGSIFSDPSNPSPNGIDIILRLYGYDEKTIQYLIALRNGLMHDGSLISLARPDRPKQYNTIFRLDPSLERTVNFAAVDWDGVFQESLNQYISTINSKKFFDEVLDIISLCKDALLTNSLSLKITDKNEFFHKFLF